MIVQTCPECGNDLQCGAYTTNPPIKFWYCPACGWRYEERINAAGIERVPFRVPKEATMENEQTTNRSQMDDLIRRSELLESLGDRPENRMDSDEEIQACADWDAFHGIVTRLPAVDAVEEKQGFWKVAGIGHPKPGNQRYRKQDQWTVYKCSNCGASNGRNHSDPYCRHCGARMLVDNCRYCYNDGGCMDGEEAHNGE